MKSRIFNLRNLTAVIVTSLILYSCKKDSNKEDLVGAWTFDNATFSTMVGSQTFTDYLVSALGYTLAEAQAFETLFNEQTKQFFTGTFTIKSDNTYTSNMGGTPDSGTWTLSADRTKLTIDSDTDDPYTVDVIEITKSKLHFQTVGTISEDLNDDGTNELITSTIDLFFKK